MAPVPPQSRARRPGHTLGLGSARLGTPMGVSRPLSAPPPPWALERAASNVAGSTALDPPGTDEGMRVSLQTMYLDERVYRSVAKRASPPYALHRLGSESPSSAPAPPQGAPGGSAGRLGTPKRLGTPRGRGRAILAPSRSTEPLPRLFQLLASAADSKADATAFGRMNAPRPVAPSSAVYHPRHISRCTTRGLAGLCAVHVRPEATSS